MRVETYERSCKEIQVRVNGTIDLHNEPLSGRYVEDVSENDRTVYTKLTNDGFGREITLQYNEHTLTWEVQLHFILIASTIYVKYMHTK